MKSVGRGINTLAKQEPRRTSDGFYTERQETVTEIITAIDTATPARFELRGLLDLFVRHAGIRRSIDKAYEIVAYTLFETLVTTLQARVRVSISQESEDLLSEFSDLARVLLGIEQGQMEWEQNAHIYRVGVTNAADRGLDMWANFGPAIQVKHLTLDTNLAGRIVDQVESDNIVVVCRDAEATVIKTITQQIGWGRRVRGIVTETDLIVWYERCLRGKFSERLAPVLLSELSRGFKAEFPQSGTVAAFLAERGYLTWVPADRWRTETDFLLTPDETTGT